jgi:hypothetical protein
MLKARPGIYPVLIVTILGIIFLVLVTLANYYYSLKNPGGSDFLFGWLGTRLFVFDGISPYSSQASQAIERMFYGGVSQSPGEDLIFVYPFYSIFLFMPFSLISDYHLARAVWMTTLEICLLLIPIVSIALIRWRIRAPMLAFLLLFSVLWYYGLRALINGNVGLLIALIVALTLLAIRDRQDVLAGCLMAFATIKPPQVVLLCLFMVIWAVSCRRWKFLGSFLGVTALLVTVSSIMIPDWLQQNLYNVVAYPSNSIPVTPSAVFTQWMPGMGNTLGWILTLALSLMILWEWRNAWGKEFYWFLWTAYLTIVTTNLIGIPTSTESYMIMFPPLVMIYSVWDERYKRKGLLLISVTTLLLFVGIWWMFFYTIQWGDQPMQGSVMYFPLPVILLVLLQYIRKWVLNPETAQLEKITL